MTLRRTGIIIALVWGALLGTSYWETRDLEWRERALAARKARRKEKEGCILATIKRGDEARKASSAVSLAIDKLHATRKAEASSSGRSDSDIRATVGRSPEMLRLYLKGFVADLYNQWGLFYRQLGLSPEQIAQFTGIQTRLEEAKVDLAALTVNEGIPATDPAISAQLSQAEKDSNQALRELLGNAKFAAYCSYSQNAAAVTLVNDQSGFGSPDAQPLSDTQAEQLTQILADASTRRQSGWVSYGAVDSQAAMPEVQAMLTASQYEAMQLMELEKLFRCQRDIQANRHP
jgi:hypothetical protein